MPATGVAESAEERAEPHWVSRTIVTIVHMEQLQEHGGLRGVRESGDILETALARPRNRFHYEATADLATLAAAYAYAIGTLHPFNDGNKRTAFVVAALFLELNGLIVAREEPDVVATMLALAAGKLDEPTLAEWIRSGMRLATPDELAELDASDE